jgi:serine/threonine protein kinase
MDATGQPDDSQECPSAEELAAFLSRMLPQPRLDSIATHARSCPACAAFLEAARGSAEQRDPRKTPPEDRFFEEPECDYLTARAMSLRPPEELARLPHDPETLIHLSGFNVGERIGSGPRGTVYHARQQHPDRKVALKVLPGAAMISRRRCRRLMIATDLAAGFTGSHVLPVFDTVRRGDDLIVITPYVEGADLARVISDRRRARQGSKSIELHPWASLSDKKYLAKALTALDQLVEALTKMHQAGALYRELKPSNCLIDQQGEVRLTDFGLGRLLGHSAGVWLGSSDSEQRANGKNPDGSNVTLGAPEFTSPEEWSGRKLGRAADVFRLGAILYQTLTLELPYGVAPVTPSRPTPVAPSTRQPLLPAELDGLLLQALAIDPEERFPSAVEFRGEWCRIRAAARTGSFFRRALRASAATVVALLKALRRPRQDKPDNT